MEAAKGDGAAHDIPGGNDAYLPDRGTASLCKDPVQSTTELGTHDDFPPSPVPLTIYFLLP